jgi:hypothetical protein
MPEVPGQSLRVRHREAVIVPSPWHEMRHLRILLAATVLVLSVHPSHGSDLPVRVTAARIGLPVGHPNHRDDPISRFACWAPVYVDLDLVGPVDGPAELVIEAPDADEITTTLAIPLELAGLSGSLSLPNLGKLGYVRPAGVGEVTITIRASGGKSLSEPFRVRTMRPRDPLTYVVLTLGAPPAAFELPKPTGVAPDASAGHRGGRVELGTITDVAQLPTEWFGYDSADLVILHTGRGATSFLDRLFGAGTTPPDQKRRDALIEWLKRGGRLVVTMGENAKEITRWPALRELLPLEVSGNREYEKLGMSWGARESSQTSMFSGALVAKEGKFTIATLSMKPDRPARVLIPPPDRRGEKDEILAAQRALGLGRLTVIGFDLDQAPFTDFAQRPEFWDWVLREGGANRASAGSEGKPKPGGGVLTEEEDELAVSLRTHIDTFEGVPVISFGWIAFLIVLYILLIGPIEYFFLKRVLGRLELTWITFPIIVVTVSIAAYFTAYSLKGRDLRINKIDVVDVDPASGRIEGTTWFTIFSPRIDNYTIGVTPGEGWSNGSETSGTVVGWIGAPQGGRASLLRRSYRYHSDADSVADGLEKVPVQVWSTKSFVARWSTSIDSALFDPDPKDPVNRRLEHPRDPELAAGVTGTFVNRLPIPVLSDCVVFYAGQAYPLPGGTIRKGEIVRLVLDSGTLSADWLKKESKLDQLLSLGSTAMDRAAPVKGAIQTGAATTPGGPRPLLGLLFHEASLTYGEGVIPRNASLRRLDQSWRLTPDNRNEVILVGRVTPPVGPGETSLSGADSPTRLWVRELPGSGSRTPMPEGSTGRQETWVRIYLPVR